MTRAITDHTVKLGNHLLSVSVSTGQMSRNRLFSMSRTDCRTRVHMISRSAVKMRSQRHHQQGVRQRFQLLQTPNLVTCISARNFVWILLDVCQTHTAIRHIVRHGVTRRCVSAFTGQVHPRNQHASSQTALVPYVLSVGLFAVIKHIRHRRPLPVQPKVSPLSRQRPRHNQ